MKKYRISSLLFTSIGSFILLLFCGSFSYEDMPTWLYLTKYILAYCLTFFISALFTFNTVILRIYFAQAIVVASLILYYQIRYGFTINPELLRSILETNASEVVLIFGDVWLYILIICLIIFCYFIFKKIIIVSSDKKTFGIIIIFQLSLWLLTYCSNYSYTRHFIKEYGNTIEPINFYSEIIKYISIAIRYRDVELDYNLYNDLKPSLNHKYDNTNIVLVIGESARASNFNLNGYNRDTTPKLRRRKNLVSYKNALSCGTSTAFSVPCLLSRKGRAEGFKLPLTEPSITYTFKKLGFNTYFYATQHIKQNKAIYDSCLEADVCEIGIKGYDEILVDKLKNIVVNNDKPNFIVLHTNGSHFLYHKQYPKEFEKFKPICKKRAYDCSVDDAINAYDNSIVYTDFVLDKIISVLQNTKTVMLYTSDHGESIGENNRYGHASFYKIAPKEQINVPFIIWMSDQFPNKNTKLYNAKKHCYKNIRHAHVFHSLLGLINNKAKVYNKELDIFSGFCLEENQRE